MGGLFSLLRDRVDHNGRRAVEVYTTELSDFRAAAAASAPARSAMLDFAVWLRRREAELAEEGRPFTEEDLDTLEAYGFERGAQGVSLADQRRVLVLHSMLTLREMQEAAGPDEVGQLMRMLGWLPANGLAAQRAYTRGFLTGRQRIVPRTGQVRDLAMMLLGDSSVAGELAECFGIPLAASYLVLVIRPVGGPAATEEARDQLVETLLGSCQVPMAWPEPDEFVALLPEEDAQRQAGPRGLAMAAEFAGLVARPCAIGAATGRVGALAQAVAQARRVSRVSPPQSEPSRLPTLRDVFVEVGACQLPEVDEWLHDLGRRLSAGPDLVKTLDAFYRHDMNRLATAAALGIHPRTLDYRLHRVRELAGMDAGSTRGVRTLSAAVARLLAG